MTKVSVQIVTYNSEAYIRTCLEAVIAQSYRVQKIIVVDNASSDGTVKILKSFADEIDLVINQDNKGFAGAHNQALRMNNSDLVVLVNPDVYMASNYIAKLAERFKAEPVLGSATGKLLFAQNPEKIDSTGLMISKARRAFDRGAGDDSKKWDDPAPIFGVSAAAAIYRRKMIEDISINGEFFDEDFFAYKEDVDVAWRAQLLGWKSYYDPKAVAYHERGWKRGSRSQQPLFIRRHSYINRYQMMLKNDTVSRIIRHLFPILLYEAVSLPYFLLREPRVLKVWADFWKNIPSNLAKRRDIFKKKRSTTAEIYSFFE